MNNFGAYLHARPNGEAFYVGKGKQVRAHNLNVRNPHHGNIVAKHGKENIIVDFVPCESEAAALALEMEWIKVLRLFGAELTNLTDGGEGTCGYVHSPEVRSDMSSRMKDRMAFPEARAKISAALKGMTRIVSEEQCAKLSSAAKGNQNSKGHAITEEMRAKMSAAQKGKIRTVEHRANISIAQKGKSKGVGRVHSAETRARMSASHKRLREEKAKQS